MQTRQLNPRLLVKRRRKEPDGRLAVPGIVDIFSRSIAKAANHSRYYTGFRLDGIRVVTQLTSVWLMVGLLGGVARAVEPQVTPQDLPRIKATEPADAFKTFKVRPGFHIELAAAEPLVVDPIAM